MLSVSTFGGLAVRDQSGDPIAIAGAKPRALFAYLALSARRERSRSHLADLLWPDDPADEARHSLRQCLTVLRRALGPAQGVLGATSDAVKLDDRQLDVDALRFAHLADSARADDWQRAAGLYLGELLGDLDVDGTPFADWLQTERRRVRESVVSLLSRIASWQSSDGDLSAAIATTRRIIALDPYDEVERRRVMRLLLRHDQAGAALREYGDLQTLLRELAVEPCDATRKLYRSALLATAQTDETLVDDAVTLQSYAQALEQLPDSVIVTDLAWRIVGWSEGAAREFGFSKADALGQTPELLHGEARRSNVPMLLARRVAEAGHWSGTVRLTHSDGRRLNLRRSVSALRLPSGRLIGTFGMTARF